jgi:hypothetical protein
MKQFGWILVLLMAASPAWAAKKITVQQLKDLLSSMQQAKKTDADVATALKQVELSEEITLPVMNGLLANVPGPYSTEQIYVLEARSAMLAPPAADLPTTPAPDAATQKAILDKAIAYTTTTYAQLPQLTATKTTLRFQDNMTAMAAASGLGSGAALSDPNLVSTVQFVQYINSVKTQAPFQHGAEQVPIPKDRGPWGLNGQIALYEQGPVLTNVIQDAQAAGKLSWLRWETVNGKTAAVYSYSVDKKKTHYAVNYCCFPNLEQAGMMAYTSPTSAASVGDHTATGNFQTATEWKNFKATLPYHGEIFVDPDTGIVVRLITQAEFKTSDLVHQEDERIDYGPVKVGDKMLVLPVKSYINTEVVPNGDSGGGKFTLRHTLFTTEYKDYN